MNSLIKRSLEIKKLWIASIPITIILIIVSSIFLSKGSNNFKNVFYLNLFLFVIEIYIVYKEIKWYIELNKSLRNVENNLTKNTIEGLKKCMLGNLGFKFGSLVLPFLVFISLIFKITFCLKLKKLIKLRKKNNN